MAAFGAETHQEARQRAVAHGDAEIFGGVEEPAQPRGIEGQDGGAGGVVQGKDGIQLRSEEHTSELQSLMRISYAVFCLKKKKKNINMTRETTNIKTNNNTIYT